MEDPPDLNSESRFFPAFSGREMPQGDQIIKADVYEGAGLRQVLNGRSSTEIKVKDLRHAVEGHLGALSCEALRYYLPAFMFHSLYSFEAVGLFANELIETLTLPSRGDILKTLEGLAEIPASTMSPATLEQLREQQLAWFDSGVPAADFHTNFDPLVFEEGAAILEFLNAMNETHGRDFPGGDLSIAIERHWNRYAQ